MKINPNNEILVLSGIDDESPRPLDIHMDEILIPMFLAFLISFWSRQ